MAIGEEILTGLKFAGSERSLDEENFLTILKQEISSISSGEPSQRLASGGEKKVALALANFFIECARRDASVDEIRELLEESGFSANRIKEFIHVFQRNKESLRINISSITSFGRAKIIDVDWRLDYNIKSSQGEKVNQMSYLVNIHTQEPSDSEIKIISFNCSLEQLQDLVGKLKDAVRCVEKQIAT